MIATTADTETFERYVQNIVDAWNAATPDQIARGRAWYPTANQLATLLSEGNTRAGAGVIAALSVQKSWALNQRLAANAFRTGEASGHFRDACGKAERIMAGEDPLEVLPEDSKSWNFYRAIAFPDDADAVVVDRHMHDLVVGEVYGTRDRGLSSKRRYATIAHVVREAARRLDEIPSVVQASTWVWWIETGQKACQV